MTEVAAAKEVLDRLRSALTTDELAQPLAPALKRAEDDVFDWLVVPPRLRPSRRRRRHRRRPAPAVAGRCARPKTSATFAHDLESFMTEHEGANVVVEWRVDP